MQNTYEHSQQKYWVEIKLFSSEINSVLAVLDEEKQKIKEMIDRLKRKNEYYRNIYEGNNSALETQ